MRYYEGMFLFDPAQASSWEAAQAELNRILDRAGARLIVSNKWDERRLAYEIRGCKRGLYALTYFQADTAKIPDLERDVQLSESILRCLVLNVDYLTEEEMKEIASRPHDSSAAEGERPAAPLGREQRGEERGGRKFHRGHPAEQGSAPAAKTPSSADGGLTGLDDVLMDDAALGEAGPED